MAKEMFHCFWREPVGGQSRYEMTDSFERVQTLKMEEDKRLSDDGYSNVMNLIVICGSRMQFIPVEVVSKYRVEPIDG